MSTPLVGALIGHPAEFSSLRKGLETFRVMGVPYVFEVISPERHPERVAEWAREAPSRGIEVILTSLAGGASLPALVAANTPLPVLVVLTAQSLPSTPFPAEGVLLAAGSRAAEHAATTALRILALHHPEFRRLLDHHRQASALRQESAVLDLRSQFPDLTDSAATLPEEDLFRLTEHDTDPGPAFRAELQATQQEPGTRPNVRENASPRTGRHSAPSHPQEPERPRHRDTEAARADTEPEDISAVPTPPEESPTPSPPEPQPPSPEDEEQVGPGIEGTEQEIYGSKPPPAPPLTRRRIAQRPLADRLFKIDPEKPDVEIIEHAMFTVLEGGTVAVPTDTVYGIAADATNAEAVERLYRMKGRNRQKALAILCHNTDMLSHLVIRFPEKVEELMEEFWPGSLTIIFPKPVGALAGVSATRSIGVRIPDNTTTLALISMVARPLATTSANLAGEPPATTAEGVVEAFGDEIDCILDGGPTPGPVASTVLSVVEAPYRILREGTIMRKTLKRILGDLLHD